MSVSERERQTERQRDTHTQTHPESRYLGRSQDVVPLVRAQTECTRTERDIYIYTSIYLYILFLYIFLYM